MGTYVESLLGVAESTKFRLQSFQFQSRHAIHVVPSLDVMIGSKMHTQNNTIVNYYLKDS